MSTQALAGIGAFAAVGVLFGGGVCSPAVFVALVVDLLAAKCGGAIFFGGAGDDAVSAIRRLGLEAFTADTAVRTSFFFVGADCGADAIAVGGIFFESPTEKSLALVVSAYTCTHQSVVEAVLRADGSATLAIGKQ
ncbi:hypothetical protein HUU05_09095 [candidate division KSB1 bacterium]|nr:hypothetical protein [candidate division KSB1 bacterium]